jgi:hypothetical protein
MLNFTTKLNGSLFGTVLALICYILQRVSFHKLLSNFLFNRANLLFKSDNNKVFLIFVFFFIYSFFLYIFIFREETFQKILITYLKFIFTYN